MINVAEDFSKYPAGRYIKDGPYSGEAFRALLVASLNKGFTLVDMKGTAGYGAGFLEEAFGGLVRVECFGLSFLFATLQLTGDRGDIVPAWQYIGAAAVAAREAVAKELAESNAKLSTANRTLKKLVSEGMRGITMALHKSDDDQRACEEFTQFAQSYATIAEAVLAGQEAV